MKILVTGADGFLGNNIVRELIERNHEVIAFLQKNRPPNPLDELDITRIYGDLLNLNDVVTAANGVDYIINAAANTSIWPTRDKVIWQVNFEGTKNIIAAAKENKVKRLVAIGTANSFGAGTIERPGDEKSPFNAGRFKLDYIDSKFAAQKEILHEVKQANLDAVIINPTFMLGPYDSKPSSGALLLALYHQKVPGYTASGRNFIHVRDVAIAVCNALTMGEKGECYVTGNENMRYQDFNELVCKEINVKPPGLPVAKPFIITYGILSQIWSYITGKDPSVSYAVANISTSTNYYSSAKARAALKLPQTPIKLAIKDAFSWFKENGYLDKSA